MSAAEGIDTVDRAILLAGIDNLDNPPRFLSSPVATAAAKTRKQLRVILISSLFSSNSDQHTSAIGTRCWNDVQATLTYIYVQASKVAQEMGKILMDIDVLLKGPDEPLDYCWLAEPEIVFRVTSYRDILAQAKLPSSASSQRTVWLEPAEVLSSEAPQPTQTHDLNNPIPDFYPVVALGGTFDHLHPGHKILLSLAAWIAQDKLIAGITSDKLLQKKANAHVLQSIEERIRCTREFLTIFKPNIEYDLVSIEDVYGPTAWDPNIQALVVSKETLSGAASIHRYREEKGLPPLKTFVIDVISHSETAVDAEDAEALRRVKMSSTAIREWIVEQAASQ